MPHFDDNPLNKLGLQAGEAEAEFDLRGLDRQVALNRVKALLEQHQPGNPSTYHLRFDPARGDGTQTLFQPLGRLLLAARREQRLQSCLPLPDGAGYFIRMAD